MNDNGITQTQSEVQRAPVTSLPSANNGFYFWLIVGCSIGGAVILTIIIATAIYCKRQSLKNKKKYNLEKPRYILGGEFCYKNNKDHANMSASSDDETGSESLSRKENAARQSFGPYPVPGILTSESVQPKQSLPSWNLISSTPCQSTATVPRMLETCPEGVSDDESDISCLTGRLWFSVTFRPRTKELLVTLIKAKYLPGRGLTNSPRDPYVKIFLLPDEETSRQSKIRKRTLAPKFNETFKFQVSPDELEQKSIRFTIYDVDKRKIRHNLGHTIFPLTRKELFGNVISQDLDMTNQQISSLGDIEISFSYNPFTNRIQVRVGSLRKMSGLTENNKTVYVKIQLHHGHKLMKSKRTVPQPLTFDSAAEERALLFDEAFNFGVSGRFFDSCSFTFTVMLANPAQLQQDKPHGRIVIGPFMYARGDQLQHWQDTLTNHRSIVTRWHNLDPIISN